MNLSTGTEEKFKTLGDIVNDAHFILFVDTKLKQLTEKRRLRPAPKDGFYYQRDWYDRMQPQGMLTADFFINNIAAIWEKKSKLSSEFREIIELVCNAALKQALLFYENKETNKDLTKKPE